MKSRETIEVYKNTLVQTTNELEGVREEQRTTRARIEHLAKQEQLFDEKIHKLRRIQFVMEDLLERSGVTYNYETKEFIEV